MGQEEVEIGNYGNLLLFMILYFVNETFLRYVRMSGMDGFGDDMVFFTLKHDNRVIDRGDTEEGNLKTIGPRNI